MATRVHTETDTDTAFGEEEEMGREKGVRKGMEACVFVCWGEALCVCLWFGRRKRKRDEKERN